jgi:serine beta-lactamase-like protein LACTB
MSKSTIHRATRNCKSARASRASVRRLLAHCATTALILAFVLAGVPSVAAQAQKPDLPQDVIERINSLLVNQMAAAKIPGLSVAVVTDLKLRWANGYGMADLENSVPATPDTTYRLASITKTITATAVMQLVEAGKLDLDAPIQRYAPTFPKKVWPVTARHLLTHTGGIRTYKAGEMESTRYYPTLTEALNVFKDDPLEYEPGTKYIYSSEGYTILAVSVEGASGMNYFDYIRKHIFEPAGMDHAQPDRVATIIPHRTQGYNKLPAGELVNSDLADTSSKAVVCANAVDLAKFAIALLSGKLVRRETLNQMFVADPVTQRRPKSVGRMGYGFAGNIIPRDGDQDLQVYKAGNQQRVSGLLYMRPERRFVVAMLCNLEHAPLTVRLARQVSDIALGEAPATH